MTREEIAEISPEALLCDGFDEAIIGMAERINFGPVVAYSVKKIIDILMRRDEMTYEDAIEYYDFNINGAWMGEFTPVFITTSDTLELDIDTTVREEINFDGETMHCLWDGVYYKNSSVNINGEIYAHIEKINTSEFSDGESYEFVVQRISDGKFFKFDVWEAGGENGHIFSDGNASLTEVFKKIEYQQTKITYE